MRTGAAKPLLRGKSILIREPTSRDRDEFLALNRESARRRRHLSSPPDTPQRFDAFVRRCRGEDYSGFLICRAEDGAVVGFLAFSQIFRGNFQSAYLGYEVASRFEGQGYMTEALQLALRFAFRDLRLHRVEANIQPGNAASIALVRRAGFVLEGRSSRYLKIGGRWRDHERWALLREEWHPLDTRTGRRRP